MCGCFCFERAIGNGSGCSHDTICGYALFVRKRRIKSETFMHLEGNLWVRKPIGNTVPKKLCLCLILCLSVCMTVCPLLFLCLCPPPPPCRSVTISSDIFCLSVCLSLSVQLPLPDCLSACLSCCPCLCLSSSNHLP